jgi:hypothetical protein
LDGKVLLCVSNFGFPWVAILGDEVAGEAGEVLVVNHLHGTFTPHDRFAGGGKVMRGLVARRAARDHGTFNSLLKPPPLGVTQQRLQVTSAPVFGVVLVGLLQRLEFCVDWFKFLQIKRGCAKWRSPFFVALKTYLAVGITNSAPLPMLSGQRCMMDFCLV